MAGSARQQLDQRLGCLNEALARQHALPIITVDEAHKLTADELAVVCDLTFSRLQRIVSLTS